MSWVLLAVLPAMAAAPARADNKAIARRYFDEIFNKGNVATIDAIVATDIVLRNPPALVKGIADFRKLVAGLRGAFFAIENGKIRDVWVNIDSLAQARQMGAVATP